MTAISERVRKNIKPVIADRILYEDMETAITLVKSGELTLLPKKKDWNSKRNGAACLTTKISRGFSPKMLKSGRKHLIIYK